jgi:hypothetical protein
MMPHLILIGISKRSFVIKGFKDLSRLKLTRLFLLFQDKRNRRRQKGYIHLNINNSLNIKF